MQRKFRRYGKIIRCRIVRDIVTGISKQYAFIEYDSSKSARDAIHDMDQRCIDDCQIIVDYEHERSLHGWKPRRLGKKEIRPKYRRDINCSAHNNVL